MGNETRNEERWKALAYQTSEVFGGTPCFGLSVQQTAKDANSYTGKNVMFLTFSAISLIA
jgi:hypothetical protein